MPNEKTYQYAEVDYKPTANDVYDDITASYDKLKLTTFNRYIADVETDFFVNPKTGSDETGTGAIMEEAFKTWTKAITQLTNDKNRVYVKGTINNEDCVSFNKTMGIGTYCTKGSSITKPNGYIMKLIKSTAVFWNPNGRKTTYENTTDAPMLILNSN